MRWKTLWKGPERGAVRYVRRFALLPTPLVDATTIWLEPYWREQRVGYTSMDGPYWEGWGAHREKPT